MKIANVVIERDFFERFVIIQNVLQFNQNYYHQLDGLAMGSPLAPAVADICMNWLTNEVLAKIKNPPIIMRYVDDLFLAFDNPNDVE